MAEAITSSGQLTTRWIEKHLNVYLNKLCKTSGVDYVVAADTDSLMIRLGTLVDSVFTDTSDTKKVVRFIDEVCKQKLLPRIKQICEELADYMNAYQQKMVMNRENIFDRGIWTARKRYILNVWNKEGIMYEKPKLKMMGIEAIRSSTPQVCRDAIKETLVVIMGGSEPSLQKFVGEFRTKFSTLPFTMVASPRGVKDLDKYYDGSSIYVKGTPINAKGSLIYNHYLREMKLDKKYQVISSGQKIKYAYTLVPNPLHCTVIACPGELPPEFNMDKYIDRDKQFDKAYLEPIKTITSAIGWEAEKRATLMSFFD